MSHNSFPTFCHISEYGLQGYSSLHRMLACSRPLVLWAPAPHVIDRLASANTQKFRITTTQLLGLIDSGYVRVLAREEWFDEKQRNAHPWEGAHWVKSFDDALRQRATDVKGSAVEVAEKADGYEVAKQVIDEKPEIVDRVWELIEEDLIPSGSASRVGRAISGYTDIQVAKTAACKEVLRDIRNHGRAFQMSTAKVPFLHPVADEFNALLDSGDGITPPSESTESRESALAKISEETFRLLELLDDNQPYGTIDRFLGSDAHNALVSWMNSMTDSVLAVGPRNVGAHLARQLVSDLDLNRGKPSLLSSVLPGNLSEKSLQLFSFGSAIFGIIFASATRDLLAAAGGFAPGIVLSGVGLARRFGWMSKGNETSNHWAYWYAFGHRGTTTDDAALLTKIRQFQEHRSENYR